jgi:hypothetical protein
MKLNKKLHLILYIKTFRNIKNKAQRRGKVVEMLMSYIGTIIRKLDRIFKIKRMSYPSKKDITLRKYIISLTTILYKIAKI